MVEFWLWRIIMETIELSESETSTLRDVVENSLSALHSEISHTDDRNFKTALRKRYELLQSILEKLGLPMESSV